MKYGFYLMLVVLFVSCTHKRDNLLVKGENGIVYLVTADSRCAECYNVEPVENMEIVNSFNCH